MDEFFAAVEKLDAPSLRGVPVLVGGEAARRGVVSTASYEARRFGCHSAMPMATAVRLCPAAVVRPVRLWRYREVSERVFGIFEQFTPLVEPLSIDEVFLEVTGSRRLLGEAEQIARAVKRAVAEQTGLTASVGVAPNKFLAKLASGLAKPDALVVVTEGNVHDVLDPLGIEKLWGVGPAAAARFGRLGIRTIGQLRSADEGDVRRAFGEAGRQFQQLARGIDDRPVTPDSRAKSIGQEQTFAVDLADLTELRRVLTEQVEQVARRLRRHGLAARAVTLKLRYGDFTTLTRRGTLAEPTCVTEVIWSAAVGLLDAWSRRHHRPLRLLGVTASQLVGRRGGQMLLFPDPERLKQQRLDRAMDEIVDRFGKGAVRRGGVAGREDGSGGADE